MWPLRGPSPSSADKGVLCKLPGKYPPDLCRGEIRTQNRMAGGRIWTHLSVLPKILEADPLLCSCGAEMKTVSIITQPRVVERILRHLGSDRHQARDPFESRAPPRARAFSL